MTSGSGAIPRTQRAVEADIERAAIRIGRAVFAARWAAGLLVFAAIVYAIAEHEWTRVLVMLVGGLAVLGLAEWMRRGSQLAAGGVLVAFAGTIVALYVMLDRMPGVLVLIVLGYRLLEGLRGTIDLAELRIEYQAVHVPREPQPGDLYTVAQGATYGVAKLLALEPDRVHIRLSASDYPTRDDAIAGYRGRRTGGHDHLPVDLAEFVRWRPELHHIEPVLPDDLAGYRTWRRVQGLEG